MDLLIEDQLLRPSSRAGEGVRKPSPVGWPPTPGSHPVTPPAADAAATGTAPSSPATSVSPAPDPTAVSLLTPTPETTTAPLGLAETGTLQLPAVLVSTAVPTESPPTAATAVLSPAVVTPAGTSKDVGTNTDPESSPGAWGQASSPATPISPTSPTSVKQALEEEDIRNIIGECPPLCEVQRTWTRSRAMGGRCRGDGGWAAPYWDTSIPGLLTLEPTVVSSRSRGWAGPPCR